MYEDGVSVKMFPKTLSNTPMLDCSCTVDVRPTRGDQKTNMAIYINYGKPTILKISTEKILYETLFQTKLLYSRSHSMNKGEW